jgi:hypothetical protein
MRQGRLWLLMVLMVLQHRVPSTVTLVPTDARGTASLPESPNGGLESAVMVVGDALGVHLVLPLNRGVNRAVDRTVHPAVDRPVASRCGPSCSSGRPLALAEGPHRILWPLPPKPSAEAPIRQ